jgi:large subunit ribosomal protein L9
MKVILLQNVSKLGKRYDVKEVNSGHALNFLIPRGLALAGTTETLKRFEIQKAKEAGEKKVQADLLEKNIVDLEQVTLNVSGKANDKGHLFAGLHREEIAIELAKQAHIQVDPSFITLEHPIKEVGEHMIEVRAGNKVATFKLVVKAKKNRE